MKSYAQWIIRHRRWVIGLVALVTVFFGLNAPAIHSTVDPAVLVPSNNAAIAEIERINRKFGSKYMMLIGITPKHGDAFQPAVLERVERMTQALAALPVVVKSNLLSLSARQAKNIEGNAEGFDVRPLMQRVPRTPAEVAALKAALHNNPVYRKVVVSEDQRTAAILVELKDTNTGVEEIIAPIHRIVAAEVGPDVEIALGGNPVYIARTEQFGRRINWLFPLAILVIGALHFEAFRTRQGLILPLVTALVAVVWGMGCMGLLGHALDIFNSPTPILILAVAAGHAVQLLKRYYEEYEALRGRGVTPVEANTEATVRSMTSVGWVMIVAGGAAALGFFSLLSFEIPTIRSFGIFTGVGILSALVLELTLIPAIRSLLPPPGDGERRREARARIWDRIPQWLGRLSATPARRAGLYGVTLAAVALCAAGMARVVVDNSSKNYFASSLPIQQDDAFLNRQFAGTNTLYVMVDGGRQDAIKDPRVLMAMDRLQQHLAAKPEVGKTLSIVDFVKRMHRAMHADDAGLDRLPAERDLISQYLFLYSIAGEPGDLDAFVDNDYRAAKLTVLLKTGSNAYVHDLIEEIRDFSRREFPADVQVTYGGDTAMTIVLSEAMVRGKIRNIIQICAAVFLLSALVFRSVYGGLLVLLPVLLAVGAVFGVMGWFGIPLNIPNSLISAMAVGIGADYAIYVLYRLREQLAAGENETVALRQTLGSAGKACLYVATAVAGGYGVLAFSIGYNIHQWLALFIVIAMVVSAGAALTLVPALALSLRPAFIFGAARPQRPVAQVALGLVLGALTLAPAPQGARAEDQAVGIMKKNFESSRVQSSLSAATFTLTNRDGESRKRLTTGNTKLQPNSLDNRRVVRFQSPADINGTATLIIEHAEREDDMWIYLPALKKVRRLSASNKRDSFVGTDFSYGDMIGHKVEEWNHRLLKEDTVDGALCYVIESTPRTPAVQANSGYSKRLSWIHKSNYSTVQAETWDEAQQPFKRMQFSDLRQVGGAGRWQAMRMQAENRQTGHRTLIEFTRFEADVKVADDVFTSRSLEQ